MSIFTERSTIQGLYPILVLLTILQNRIFTDFLYAFNWGKDSTETNTHHGGGLVRTEVLFAA
jgi:hypothetical protein